MEQRAYRNTTLGCYDGDKRLYIIRSVSNVATAIFDKRNPKVMDLLNSFCLQQKKRQKTPNRVAGPEVGPRLGLTCGCM